MASQMPNLNWASLTDVGLLRLANEDAYHSDPRMGLYVVCDGIGGQPSGEAASQIIAHSLGHVIRRILRQVKELNPQRFTQLLVDAVQTINANLYLTASELPALHGMGATLVAALFDGPGVLVVNAGDSRAYLLRDSQLGQLSTDHTRSVRQYRDLSHLTAQEIAVEEKRLLMQFVGTHIQIAPQVRIVPLKPGDRVLLCTDGLIDPLKDDSAAIASLLASHPQPAAAVQALVNAANGGGGPDNITVTVVDFLGMHEVDRAALKPPAGAAGEPRQGLASWFHTALGRIEQDLGWLAEGAGECRDLNAISAFAAVKRRLGAELYTRFLQMHPTQNPAHVFHRACTMPNLPWRSMYDAHMQTLEPNVAEITNGSVRLSPILNAEETSLIIRTLWSDWRRVEQTYFRVCQRDAISESEQTLNILIDHMLASARTIRALLEFFPRYMR